MGMGRHTGLRRLAYAIGVAALASALAGCGAAPGLDVPAGTRSPTSLAPTTSSAPTTTSAPITSSTTTTMALLQEGDKGPLVLDLQERLISIGYWLGTPDGVFGDSTQQAVFAIQKAAGIQVDGMVGPKTQAALNQGVRPSPRSTSGYVVEVNLRMNLVMFVDDGHLEYTLNTSTGGGYTFTVDGQRAVAATPVGKFHVIWEKDGLVANSLGELWRPKFFYSGFAIHGDSFVPPYPASHGCVRVSNEAIDWIWAQKLAPVGTAVWTYW